MNFITKKVLELQYKNLNDSKKRLNQHLEKRESLLNSNSDSKKEIEKIEKYIVIWNKNIQKIEKEIKKIEYKESQ
jgi:predicted  nucleic acid-binding Zn-ribbon protein